MTKINFDNYSKKIYSKGDTKRFQWRVFVNENESILDTIENITYLLHPTFADPLRVIKNLESKFALESSGWGEFDIQITIKFKNGEETKQTYHLKLNKEWPEERLGNKEELLKILGEERWYARTFNEISSRVSDLTDDQTRDLLKHVGAVKVQIPNRDEEFWGFPEDVIKMLLNNEKWDMRSFNTIFHYFPEKDGDELRKILRNMGSEKRVVNGNEMWGHLR